MAIDIKGKKKRWNGMDLFFIVIIAIIIAALAFVFGNMGRNGADSQKSNTVSIEYTVEFRKMSNDALGAVKEGDSVRDPDNKRNIGTIVSVQSMPYATIAYNSSDGTVYMAENPDLSDLMITIRAEALHTDSGYYVNDARFLVGRITNIWSSGFAGSGYCISIREID